MLGACRRAIRRASPTPPPKKGRDAQPYSGQSQQRRPHLIFVTRCATKQRRVSLLRKWGHWAFLSTRSTPFWSSMVMMESCKYESTPKRRNGAGVGPAPFVKRNAAGPASVPMRSVLSLVECNQICIPINWFSAQRVLGWSWSVLKNNGPDVHSLAMRPDLSIRERTKSFRPLNQADTAGGWRLVIGFRRRLSLRAALDGIGHVAQAHS